jgi:hypothetical protein
MGNKIQLKRGTSIQRVAVVLDSGEPGWDTDKKALYVGDGSTPGGVPISNISILYNDQVGTTYTLQASDVGKVIRVTNTAAITITVPLGIFTKGDLMGIEQGGTGQVTLVGASGVTVNSTMTLKTYGVNAVCGLVCGTTSTTFNFTGDRAIT